MKVRDVDDQEQVLLTGWFRRPDLQPVTPRAPRTAAPLRRVLVKGH